MADARDFRCQSGVVDNLSDATLPSDHIPVRLTMEMQTHRPQITAHVRLWMTKHSTFNPTLTRLHESCRYGCSATVQRHGDNCEGAHSRGDLEKKNSRNTRWEIVDRQYCSSRIQESPPHHALRCWAAWEAVKRCVDPVTMRCIDLDKPCRQKRQFDKGNVKQRIEKAGMRTKRRHDWQVHATSHHTSTGHTQIFTVCSYRRPWETPR